MQKSLFGWAPEYNIKNKFSLSFKGSLLHFNWKLDKMTVLK